MSRRKSHPHKKSHPHQVFHYPKESGDYNFIQVLMDLREPGYREYPILILPNNGKTHGEILEEFLKRMNLHYPFFDHGKKKVPSLRGKDYSITGLGRGYFDKEEITLEVSEVDTNTDYGSAGLGIRINKEHLNEITKHSKMKVKYKE